MPKCRENGSIGLVFNIKRYAIHDGPGIRTTIFMKGCPLRCLWCDNPESQNSYPEIVFSKERCIGCGECLKVCPAEAVTVNKKGLREINPEKCTLCGKCANMCYAGALEQVGKHYSVDDIMKEIKKDVILYQLSGGGVTLSGGEPTFQPKFIEEVLRRCKDNSINTVLDTCGYVGWKTMEAISKYVDLMLYDIKVIDNAKHRRYTGVSNTIVLQNAIRIDKKGIPMWIRIPVIHGYNDSEKDVKDFIHFISKLNNVMEVNLLPYHRLGEMKYEKLKRKYVLKDLEPLDSKVIRKIKERMELYDLKVRIEV